MPAKKGKPPPRGHSFNMGPLMAKLEESISKINGKLGSSKRRISDESPATKQSKQARILPGVASDFAQPSGAPPNLEPAGLEQAAASWETANIYSQKALRGSQDSAKQLDLSTSLGSSSANPIDLTTPPSSPPSHASPGSMGGKYFFGATDLMPNHPHVEAQIQMDEAIAMRLQGDINHEPSDLNEASSHASFDDAGVFGAPRELDMDFEASSLAAHLRGMRCAKCRNPMPLDWDMVVARTKDCMRSPPTTKPTSGGNHLSDTGFLHPYLECPKCKLWSCCGRGCKKYHLAGDFEYPIHASRPDLKLTWCCDESRLYLIFSLACGPDPPRKQDPVISASASGFGGRFRRAKANSDPLSSSSQPPETTAESAKGKAATKLLSPLKAAKLGRPYVSQLSKGTGYGGPEYDPRHLHPHEVPDALGTVSSGTANKSTGNHQVEQYFWALAALLPCYSRDKATEFDYAPQPTVAFMLARSPLLSRVTELMRQSSVEEMATRRSIYKEMLELLDGMAGHTDIIPLLYQDQLLYGYDEQLGSVAFIGLPSIAHTPDLSSPPETTQSLDALMQKLSDHCQYFVQAASVHPEEFKNSEEQGLLLLAKQIIDSAGRLEKGREAALASLPLEMMHSAPKLAAPVSSVTTRARFAKEAETAAQDRAKGEITSWHRENCVRELPDEKILESFYFASNAKDMKSSKLAPGRMRRLVKQIASLRTDLPEGIYVRHGASRLDLMKVLIVGPQGTPYENGLFEFDLFCRNDFPQRPPEMQFRTTGGGLVAFNPNLYNNGKVCLSLLGTWSGQSWEPEKSTILQILVSIQAMILNDQPWYNEPGRETSLNENKSKSYNKTIWQSTIQHAMLYWLNNRLAPPDQDAIEVPARRSAAPKQPYQPLKTQRPKTPPPKTQAPKTRTPEAPALKSQGEKAPLNPPHASHPLAQSPQSLFAGTTSVIPSHHSAMASAWPPPSSNAPIQASPLMNWDGTATHPSQFPFPEPYMDSNIQLWNKSTMPTSQLYTQNNPHQTGIYSFWSLPIPYDQTHIPISAAHGTLSPADRSHGGNLSTQSTGPGFEGKTTSWLQAQPHPQGLTQAQLNEQGKDLFFAPLKDLEETAGHQNQSVQQPKDKKKHVGINPINWETFATKATAPGSPPYITDLVDHFKMVEQMQMQQEMVWQEMPIMPGVGNKKSDTKPIGNTVVDSRDDYVWGEVIRKHFSLKGNIILISAKKSPYNTPSAILKELEGRLKSFGFA